MRIEFDIPCEVVPKQSDRSRIVSVGDGRQWVQHYPPGKVVKNRELMAGFLRDHIPDKPLEGPLRLHVVVVYQWPKSFPKRKRLNGPVPKDTKPDADNLKKQIMDVMESCGFFKGDQQVADSRCQKFWWEKPLVHVMLEHFEPDGELMNTVNAESLLEFAGVNG